MFLSRLLTVGTGGAGHPHLACFALIPFPTTDREGLVFLYRPLGLVCQPCVDETITRSNSKYVTFALEAKRPWSKALLSLSLHICRMGTVIMSWETRIRSAGV